MKILTVLTAGAALAGCAPDLFGPSHSAAPLPDALEVDFTLSDAEVEPHEPFEARLVVTNTSADTVRIVTAHGCLALPHAMRGGARVPLRGTAIPCTGAVTTHTLAPAQSRTLIWNLAAALYAEHEGDGEGAPAPTGDYRVQAVFDLYSAEGTQNQPRVEAPLRVH